MATAELERVVEIKGVGPIQHLTIPLPETGGLTVLRGANGTGKSTAIHAVQALTGHNGTGLSINDEATLGKVSGLGVNLTVGRSTRRTGELVVESLDSKLDIGTLIDPGIADPAAADLKRIKKLVALSGAKPDIALFYDLVGDQADFEAVVTPAASEADDLPTMAAKVKRDLEAAARKAESLAEHAAGHAKANKEAADQCPIDAPSDQAELNAAVEQAIRDESKLLADKDHAERLSRDAAAAKEALLQAEAEYTGPSIGAALEAKAAAEGEYVVADAQERQARQAYELAKQQNREAGAKVQEAVRAVESAKAHEALISRYREQIQKVMAVEPVVPETLQSAHNAVILARNAVERGVLARKGKQHLQECERSAIEQREHAKRAEKLREAAKLTDDVLSNYVAQLGCALRVRGGRLMLDTNRGPTFLSDLSFGERSKIVIDIAAEAVGPNGIVPIGQEFFEGLDPINRREVAQHFRDRGAIGLTALADEGPLRAELFAV